VLIKIHSRGAGRGSGPTGYLMGEKDHAGKVREVAPVVLRGDPEQTRELIDSLSFKRNYTSGVLSFSEADIPADHKQKIMDSWEGALFPGMDKNQYSVLWVEHRDKGRLELNFVIPNVELQTGKRLQPYFDKADRNRVDAWQTLTNAAYGLTDPKDPERVLTLSPAQNLPKSHQEAAEAITRGLVALGVKNRSEVVQALSEAGFEIARQTKNNLSIKDPDGGRNLRLKGAIYAEDYRGGEELRAARDATERSYREGRESRIREAQERYRGGIEKRADYLRERYPKPEPQTLDARDIARASAGRVAELSGGSIEPRVELVPIRERPLTGHTDQERRREDVAGVSADPHRQGNQKPILPNSEISHEPKPTGTDALRRARSARDRATERAQSNERHATGDRPASRIAQAIGELADRVNQSFERAREFIREKLTEITKAEQKRDKGHGMSR
jgi:Relaxase/Mobilisation nuclease domain